MLVITHGSGHGEAMLWAWSMWASNGATRRANSARAKSEEAATLQSMSALDCDGLDGL
jgi:hypothetical protein